LRQGSQHRYIFWSVNRQVMERREGSRLW